MRRASRARADNSFTSRRSRASILPRIDFSESAMKTILNRRRPPWPKARPATLLAFGGKVAHRQHALDPRDLLDQAGGHLAVDIHQRVGHLPLRLVDHVVDVELRLG